MPWRRRVPHVRQKQSPGRAHVPHCGQYLCLSAVSSGANFVGRMEPFVLTLENGGGSGPNAMLHTGHEFFFCLRGMLEYQIEDHIFLLGAGNSLIFAAKFRHRWRNPGNTVVNALIMLADFSETDRDLSAH